MADHLCLSSAVIIPVYAQMDNNGGYSNRGGCLFDRRL